MATSGVTDTSTTVVVSTPPGPFASIPPHIRQQQLLMQDTFYWVFTPLNVSLFLILATVLYLRFRPAAPVELPNAPLATVFRTFTPRTLLPNNGTNGKPVYLAVKGKVYDVTAGRNFYGPGGPYENFAGRDATRGLACQSFDEDMLTENLDGPLDKCDDLTADQIENLNGWVERFDEKYLIVGNLKAFRTTEFH